MNREKALKILGLKSDFTDEDLKKAYRTLSKQFHPDLHNDAENKQKMTEIMKIINEAHDYLLSKSNINNASVNKNDDYIDLKKYLYEKIVRIKEIINFNYENYGEYVTDDIQRIIKILVADAHNEINNLEWIVIEKDNIDATFNTFIMKKDRAFQKLKNTFYKEYFISEEEVNAELDYNVSLEEFFNTLIRIKTRFSKQGKFEKRIELETERYKTYAGYKHVKKAIDIYKDKMLKIAKEEYGFEDSLLETLISSFHNNVLKKFEYYYRSKNIFIKNDIADTNFYYLNNKDDVKANIIQLDEFGNIDIFDIPLKQFEKEYITLGKCLKSATPNIKCFQSVTFAGVSLAEFGIKADSFDDVLFGRCICISLDDCSIHLKNKAFVQKYQTYIPDSDTSRMALLDTVMEQMSGASVQSLIMQQIDRKLQENLKSRTGEKMFRKKIHK